MVPIRWYHWVAAYVIIIAAFAFWSLPQKSLLLAGVLVAVIALAIIVIKKMPYSDDNEAEKKPPI